MPIIFQEGKQIEEMLKLYGIELPCHVHFVGDDNQVMFKFDNMPKEEKEDELIEENNGR